MGDRSNIFIQTDRKADGTWEGIGVYAHSFGAMLHDTAIAALPKANRRLGDEAYFARILVQNVLNAFVSPDSEIGAGLWTRMPCDNEHPILVINASTGEHWFASEDNYRDSK